jgi:hypothetical protein
MTQKSGLIHRAGEKKTRHTLHEIRTEEASGGRGFGDIAKNPTPCKNPTKTT